MLHVDEQQLSVPQVDVSLPEQTAVVKNLTAQVLGLQLNASLNASFSGSPTVNGELTVMPFDAKALLTRLGQAPLVMADEQALRKVGLTTTFEAGADKARLHALTLNLDDSKLQGHLLVNRFVPPSVEFGLQVNSFNVDRYLPPPAPKTSTPAPLPDGGPVAMPIDFLRTLDADGTLAVKQLQLNGMKVQDIVLKLTSHAGQTVLEPMAQLYQGKLGGKVKLDSTINPPRATVEKHLIGIQAEPLLTDWQHQPAPLSGRGDLHVTMQINNAATLQSFQHSAGGDIAFAFSDGAIKGFNLADKLRQAQALITGKPIPTQQGPLQTDFTELRGTLRGKNGVFHSDDLTLNAPVLRVQGQGTLDTTTRQMDYLLNVHVVNTLTGQGGKGLESLNDVRIPVRISGAFNAPSIKVDVQNLLKEHAKRQAQQQWEKHEEEIQRTLQKKIGDKAGDAVLEGLKGLFH